MTDANSSGSLNVSQISRVIRDLKNSDVKWDGTLLGLTPTIVSAPARQLLDSGDAAVPELIHALEDESRFAIAHVLLTFLTHVQYRTTPWNGLRVELSPDNQAHIDAGQRFELARRWRAWQQADPHPQSLQAE